MKFSKTFLQGLVWEDYDEGLVEIIYSKIVDKSRWSIVHEMVFKIDDKYYITHYSIGATEQQDESPFEYDADEIECEEVEPQEVTTVVYRKKNVAKSKEIIREAPE